MTKSVRWWRNSLLDDKGDQERPLGSNKTKYGRQYGWNGVAWCVIYCWLKYAAAGVVLPLKTASCVALYDASEHAGLLRRHPGKGRVGDAVIRGWQHLARHAPGFDPSRTHCQEILYTKRMGRTVRHPLGVKWFGLWGGNQGAGYVGPEVEWVASTDPSILGVLAFRSLFSKRRKPAAQPTVTQDKERDTNTLPAAKSHKHPRVGKPARRDAVALTRRLHGKEIRDHRAVWRRLRDRIDRKLHRGDHRK